ncbi:MAG: hypothetical protein V4632_11605, partial [Pseudomonadota bacterium]
KTRGSVPGRVTGARNVMKRPLNDFQGLFFMELWGLARLYPRASGLWIPAFAGMTVVRVEVVPITTVIPAKAGIQTELASRCLHADDGTL